MKWLLSITLLHVAIGLAKPANDWSKPCFDGECAYDILGSTGNSGVLHMYGNAITDITPAAGWVILDCDAHALEQDVRLVCSSADQEATSCNHVFDSSGPLNKVVRLPESCSAAPFLRIASASVAEDQTIPRHAVSKVSKRDGVTPTVHIFRVDANWDMVDVSQTGTVNFTFTGTNNPSAHTDPVASTHDLHTRGLFSWVADRWNDIKTTVTKATSAVLTSLKDLTSFKLHPQIHKSAKASSPDQSILTTSGTAVPKCASGSLSAHLDVVVGGQAEADVRVGITANGSIIPPSVGSFAVYAMLTANVDAHVKIDASITGTLGTGRKELGRFAVTPVQIPAVIALGPILELHAEAELDMSLEVNLDTHFKYTVSELEFWYPKSISNDAKGAKSGLKNVASTPAPLSISASLDVSADATITAHLIPSLQLGLSVGDGKVASLTAFVEADIWAKAHVRGEASVQTPHGKRQELSPPHIGRGTKYIPPYSINGRDVAVGDAGASFKGCVDVSAGLIVRGGGQGSLGPWKETTPEWIIAETDAFVIYENCWGGAKKKRAEVSIPRSTSLVRRTKATKLNCPKSKTGPKTVDGKLTTKLKSATPKGAH